MRFEIPSHDVEAYIMCLVGGVFLIYTGLKNSKLYRKIKDTPTSKISNAHIGDFVEIKGSVFCEEEDIQTSPLSNVKCVFYTWNIQKRVKTKNSHYWKTIETIHSSPFFLIRDESNKIAIVNFEACEEIGLKFLHKFNRAKEGLINLKNSTSKNGFVDAAKEHFSTMRIINAKDYKHFNSKIKKILERKSQKLNSEKMNSFFSGGKYRIVENHFHNNEKIFIIGTAHIFSKRQKNKFVKLLEKQRIKKSLPSEFRVDYGKDIKFSFNKSKTAKGLFKLDKVFYSFKKEEELVTTSLRVARACIGIGIVLFPVGVLGFITL